MYRNAIRYGFSCGFFAKTGGTMRVDSGSITGSGNLQEIGLGDMSVSGDSSVGSLVLSADTMIFHGNLARLSFETVRCDVLRHEDANARFKLAKLTSG
jgi:hypothetical protein